MPQPKPEPVVIEPHDAPETDTAPVDDLVEEELLVEDVSIDGMCGVY